MRLTDDCGAAHEAIAFGAYTGTLPSGRIHAAYQLLVDDYRDQLKVKLLLHHFAP